MCVWSVDVCAVGALPRGRDTLGGEDARGLAEGVLGLVEADVAVLGLAGELGLDLGEEEALVGQRKVGPGPVLLHVAVVVLRLPAVVQQLHEEGERQLLLRVRALPGLLDDPHQRLPSVTPHRKYPAPRAVSAGARATFNCVTRTPHGSCARVVLRTL